MICDRIELSGDKYTCMTLHEFIGGIGLSKPTFL